MADRDSASESDSSSVDGGPIMMPPSPVTREQLHKRIESLQQGNKVLRLELESMKQRFKQLQEENRNLRQASVTIQARAEQEEEFISNTLLKKIQALKKEKETLALNYEQEEECLTNDLSRKLNQLRQEKVHLEATLEQEQECLVNKLMRRIERLEAETVGKQQTLEQLRREKVELENTLEQEQEALVNKLWKRMGKLESEKRLLKGQLEGTPGLTSGGSSAIASPDSPRGAVASNGGEGAVAQGGGIPGPPSPQERPSQIIKLRHEAAKLRQQLNSAQKEHTEKMQVYVNEEKQIRTENVRLQQKLAQEKEKRLALSRQLSESESSLEMDEDRYSFYEAQSSGMGGGPLVRARTGSSPVPVLPVMSQHGPSSPGKVAGQGMRCHACGQFLPSPSPPPSHMHHQAMCGINVSVGLQGTANDGDGFVKPSAPSPGAQPAMPGQKSSSRSIAAGSPMPSMDMRSSVSPAPSPMDTSRGIDSEDDTRSVDGDGDDRKEGRFMRMSSGPSNLTNSIPNHHNHNSASSGSGSRPSSAPHNNANSANDSSNSATASGPWMGQAFLFKDTAFIKYIESYNYPFCEDVTKYEKLAKIGQGTFGEVFKAKNKETRQTVALKKVLMENEKEGFPITALRELKILQLLDHDNVVNLIEICRTKATQFNRFKSTFFLVFEFCEHDLAGLLSNVNVKFNLGEIKKVMQQLLNGLYFIHSNKILHRDMKAANILITKKGVLKLADFGLARPYSLGQVNRYTNRVVTLWYRPPELLLGERNYGPAVDCWGAGCIMAEMWTRSPIMQGNTEQHQLNLIVHLCGSITPDIWPNVESLELFSSMEIPKNQKRKVKDRLRTFVKDVHALDLLDKLLALDPNKRMNADTALQHDFFWQDPLPQELESMLRQHTQSMFEYYTPPRRPRHQQPAHQQHPHPHGPHHPHPHGPRHPHPPHGRGGPHPHPQPMEGFHERVF